MNRPADAPGASAPSAPAPATAPGRPSPAVRAGTPGRSAAEIRRDIEALRGDLAHSVVSLRRKVGELTDLRRQVREHRRELIAGAAIAGFVLGGLLALRRRGGE